MPKPVLYVFAISHFCEKARWALDYLEIAHELVHLAPGLHRGVAKKLGCKGTSLPILVADGEVLQGSSRIIDWADNRVMTAAMAASPGPPGEVPPTVKRLSPDGPPEDCLAIEKRLDDVAGIHVRRLYYSEALVEHPETVRPIFTRDLPFLQKLIITWKWKMISGVMIKRMDLGAEQFEDSKSIVEGELSWLDGLLTDGRKYLLGPRFSRADLAASSLFAPLVMPPEHPSYAGLSLPPRLAGQVAGWQDRPTLKWVQRIYRDYR